jgi:hypothetical protein
MRGLHRAVMKALLSCHLFDVSGRLHPFSFPEENFYRSVVRTHKRLVKGERAAGDLKNEDINWEEVDFRLEDVNAGWERWEEWPYTRLGDLDGTNAAFFGVPDPVVRLAWAKASPWMHTPLPEWWAFKVHSLRLSLSRCCVVVCSLDALLPALVTIPCPPMNCNIPMVVACPGKSFRLPILGLSNVASVVFLDIVADTNASCLSGKGRCLLECTGNVNAEMRNLWTLYT